MISQQTRQISHTLPTSNRNCVSTFLIEQSTDHITRKNRFSCEKFKPVRNKLADASHFLKFSESFMNREKQRCGNILSQNNSTHPNHERSDTLELRRLDLQSNSISRNICFEVGLLGELPGRLPG